MHPSVQMQSPDAALGQSSLVTTSQGPSIYLPSPDRASSRGESAALPSHGFPSVVSVPVTSFSFCPEKVVSLSQASPKPEAWKDLVEFQAYLQHCSRDETSTRRPWRPPTPRAPTPDPLALAPEAQRTVSRLPGSREFSNASDVLEEPAVPRWWSPLPFLSFSAPQSYSNYTYQSSGPPATSAPLHSIYSDSPWPLAQPERGLSRRRRHVPKETAGNQWLTGDPRRGTRPPPCRSTSEPAPTAASPSAKVTNPHERSASSARPRILSASNPEGHRTVAPPGGPGCGCTHRWAV